MNQSLGRGQHILEHNKDCLFLSTTPNHFWISKHVSDPLLQWGQLGNTGCSAALWFEVWCLNCALMYQGKASVSQDRSRGCQQIASSVPRTWTPLPVPGPGFVEKTLLVSGKLFQAALMMFTWKEKEGGGRKHLNPCRVWSLLWSHPVWSLLLGLWSVGGWCVFSRVLCSVLCSAWVQKAAYHGSLWSGENRKWHLGSTTEDELSLAPRYWTGVICSIS